MCTEAPLPRYFRVLILALPALVIGCANTDQKTLRRYIEQNQPFEVRWMRAERWLIESEEDLINIVQIDTGAKIVRLKRDSLIVRTIPIDYAAISKLKLDLFGSGLFELESHPSLVAVDVGFTEISISCNRVTFELRSYDLESTDPPELIHNKVDVVSKVTAAIQELSIQPGVERQF
ncbi:MAG: hypothetical protein MUC83_01780 [Pirellula sp.]|jgi:hypothetical protein|nr:hypothetical protein [Pirellula sp.]